MSLVWLWVRKHPILTLIILFLPLAVVAGWYFFCRKDTTGESKADVASDFFGVFGSIGKALFSVVNVPLSLFDFWRSVGKKVGLGVDSVSSVFSPKSGADAK